MSQQASSQVVTLEAGTHWLRSSSPYTWWVALALFPVLLVATVRVHRASGWLFTNEGGSWEFPAFFAVTTLVQFLLGGGVFALSSRLRPRR